MSERNIETVRKYNFDPKEVIAGLNGYYESDKRNDYITVRRNDIEGPAYLTAVLYLSALIEWLREDHDIFYRPGLIFDQVGAARSVAKMCCLRAHIKDEISKRGLWCDKDADIPELVDTLFKAYDECKEHRDKNDKNRKDAVKLSKENGELKESVCKDIMNYIRYESFRNGFELPEEIDGEPLTIKRVFHDLLELMRKRETEIKDVRKKHWNDLRDINKALGRDGTCDNTDGFAKAVKARAEYLESLSRNAEREVQKEAKQECYKYLWNALKMLSPDCDALKIDRYEDLVDRILYEMSLANDGCKRCRRDHSTEKFDYIRRTNKLKEQLDKATADYQALREENQKLKNSQKSDINQLIRDHCIKHGIVAPSRYLTDEACVEYLFSVIDQKDRSFAILQDLYRDIFKRQPNGLSAEDIANKILDRMLMTEDLLHKSVDSVNKECKATGRLMLDDYKLKLKDYILKDIKEHGYRYDGLETKSIEEIVDWIITMVTCPRDEWAASEIRNLRGHIDSLKGLINAMNEEVGDM